MNTKNSKNSSPCLKDSIGIKIDMVQLNGIRISSIINLEYLFDIGVAKYDIAAPSKITLPSGEEFTSLRIQDENYGIRSFTYQLGLNHKKQRVAYGSLQLVVDEPDYKNLNCRSFSELLRALDKVKAYLLHRYGILLSYDDAVFHTIEINKTFPFAWNTDVLETLIYLIPPRKRMPYRPPFNTKIGTGTGTIINTLCFTAYSKKFKEGYGAQAKFYDKSEQLQRKYEITVDDHYLRFELSYAGARKIKQIFGTNKLQEFSQDIINDAFYAFIKSGFVQPYENFCDDRSKMLRKIFTSEFLSPHRSPAWIHDVILKLVDKEKKKHFHQILQDIHEIYEIWGSIPFRDRAQRAYYKNKLKVVCENDFSCLLTNTDAEAKRLLELLLKTE